MVVKKSKASPKKVNTGTVGFALKNFWTDYVGWGRANRAEYWWPQLFYNVLFSIAEITTVVILAFVFAFLFGEHLGVEIANVFDWFISFGWWGATVVPSFCLGVRRLHDTNRSAWNFCWAFLPIVGWILLIVFMCQKGEAKKNRFGEPRM